MSFDLDAGGVIDVQLGGYVNADRRLKYAASTTGDTETSGSNKTLTLADASGFNVGDYVVVQANAETHITAISGNDITVAALDVGTSGAGKTVTKVRGTPSWPALDPYPQTNVFIDLDIDKAGWTGHNEDAKKATFTYTGNVTPKTHRPSADAPLNQTWTKRSDGIPTLTGSVTLLASEDEYFNFKRSSSVRKGALRIMGYSAAASGNTTTSNNETAGSAKVVEVVSTSGFAVNDWVIFIDDANNKQAVGKITALVADTSITIATLDVDIAAGSSVYNTAFMVKIPDFDVTSSPGSPDGDDYIVTVNFSAKVDEGESNVITIDAYDDDNS